jgi:hypothetical protein
MPSSDGSLKRSDLFTENESSQAPRPSTLSAKVRLKMRRLGAFFFITLYNFFLEKFRAVHVSVKSLILFDILVEPIGIEPTTS